MKLNYFDYINKLEVFGIVLAEMLESNRVSVSQHPNVSGCSSVNIANIVNYIANR